MIKFFLFALTSLSLSSAFAASDCTPVHALGLCAQIQFEHAPTSDKDAPFTITYTKLLPGGTHGTQRVLSEHPFTVNLFMPDMGHGSSPVTISLDETNVIYHVKDVYFVMAGAWEIRLNFVTADNKPIESIAIPVSVPNLAY